VQFGPETVSWKILKPSELDSGDTGICRHVSLSPLPTGIER